MVIWDLDYLIKLFYLYYIYKMEKFNDLFIHTDYTYVRHITYNVCRIKKNDTTYIVKLIQESHENFIDEPMINDYINDNTDFCRKYNIICIVDKIYISNKLYLVMDDVNGIQLIKYIENIISKDNFTDNKILLLRIMTDIIRAIKHLHSLNILHLDIKPDNIIVSEDNRGYLLDFGISCVINIKVNENIDCTPEKLTRGTIGFMSREVINRNIKNINKWSDIYSLGRVIAEINILFMKYYSKKAFLDIKQYDIIKNMYNENIEIRPNIDQLYDFFLNF
jgi:serine/threonine protein kinase